MGGVLTEPLSTGSETSPQVRGAWTSLHLFAHWESSTTDEFLAGSLRTVLDQWRADGRLRDWFFIRYWEGGPHIRVRASGVDSPRELREELAALLGMAEPAAHQGGQEWQPHGTVAEIGYEAEVERYGGASALAVAEQVFSASSALALDTIGTVKGNRRLVVVVQLAYATALALGLTDAAAARWLRRHANAWRWIDRTEMAPAATLLARVTSVLSAQRGGLERALNAVRAQVADAGAGDVVGRWATVVADADARLRTLSPVSRLTVWASQLHMLCNRLGVHPDEERAACFLVAAVLLGESSAVGFDADQIGPDHSFLEKSKLLPGHPAVLPAGAVDTAETDTTAWLARTARVVELPDGPPLTATLADVLVRRRSARRFGGAVSIGELGTLLRSSLTVHERDAADGRHEARLRRGYPSAGTMFPARLRAFVWSVDDLRPGSYLVDPAGCRLLRYAEAPDTSEVAELSPWFLPEAGARTIDAAAIPVMLVLSVRLDEIRARYGVRGLRFALIEAGHLAQNLVLCATGLGLESLTIGGFYDDLVHETLGMDGLAEAAQYLIPVGRSG
ncbi:thiopeptide-type bacteriocin biosynthesis protein [Actinokineospora guangxiensis]|uniref:Thiopeptide-type bacteriocin biosynthesis protein n=1 Tax=Actinokineospora guangxiensis TaxID=1490288 RepID=A0ABW0EPJ2_9PSEU